MFYIMTHKGCNPYYTQFKNNQVLHMGFGPSDSQDYLFDTTGDSIAERNPNFCELTGIYWIWKNGSEQENDIIGLEHYRRFFMKSTDAFLDEQTAFSLLAEKDIILPERMKLTESVREQYCIWHRREDLLTLEAILAEMYPQNLATYRTIMDRDWLYPCNMMICRKQLLDAYCNWLFPLLFELEKRIDVNRIQDLYQKRVFGFQAERLLNVWVEANRLSVAELPVFILL